MPGPRVTPVRRTVGVAVALVTGQALLGGIIGFVTFGGESDTAPGTGTAAPQIAGPPIVLPPASLPPSGRSAAPKKPATRKSSATTRPASRRPTPAPERRSAEPSATTARPATPSPTPRPTKTTTPPGLVLLPPLPADDEGSEDPVVVRERCDDEGATGRTSDGKVVRCVRGRDGDLRWQLV
jgi:hypothetical protein